MLPVTTRRRSSGRTRDAEVAEEHGEADPLHADAEFAALELGGVQDDVEDEQGDGDVEGPLLGSRPRPPSHRKDLTNLATLICYAKEMPTDSQNLARAVAQLNRRLRQERRSDLTPSQLSVLATLKVLGPSSPTRIAARERVTAPSITRTLNCLVEDGYARREPHPEDRRQVIVTISDVGEEILAEERERSDAWLHERLKSLGAKERAMLREAAAVLSDLAES